MHVVEAVRSVEPCTEVDRVGYDFVLDQDIDMDFVRYLAPLGHLLLLEDLPDPFFRITSSSYTVRGLCRKNVCRVGVEAARFEILLDEIQRYFDRYGKS